MRLSMAPRSFAFKLAVAVTLLALAVAGTTLVIFAHFSRQAMLEEMQERLKDVAHNGSFMFREFDREMLASFSERVLRSPNRRAHLVSTIPEGETRESLSPEVSQTLMDAPEFQHLVQLLRRIQRSSTDRIGPLEWMKQDMGDGLQPPDIYSAYLMVTIPESPDHRVIMFVADSNHERFDKNKDGSLTDVETGNPTGSLYRSDYETYGAPFDTGRLVVSDDWYTDQWGTFMTAVVPLMDAEGKIIATLGMDYLAHAQVRRLREKITSAALWVLMVSLVLSVAVGAGLAAYVNIPINRLRRGAERIAARNSHVRIDVRARDEFGLLADTLNSMSLEVAKFRSGLETLVEQRTSELSRANEAIGALNQALARENRALGLNVDWLRQLQVEHARKACATNGSASWELAVIVGLHPELGGDWLSVDVSDDGAVSLCVGSVPGLGVETALAAMLLKNTSDLLLRREAGLKDVCAVLSSNLEPALIAAHPWLHFTSLALRAGQEGAVSVDGFGDDMFVARVGGYLELIDTTQWSLPPGPVALSHHEPSSSGLTLRLQKGEILLAHSPGLVHCRDLSGNVLGHEGVRLLFETSVVESSGNMGDALRSFLQHGEWGDMPSGWTCIALKRL
jgi:sigma-B regulation protein RsbU (phosphoserine phosphatase)